MIYFRLGIFMILVGLLIYGYSFHNVDLSVNMAFGSVDHNALGFTQDRELMYLNGISGLGVAQILEILGIVLILKKKDF